MKSNKGITLVALVVTIIVLIILAAVTITMVLGNEGILGKAQQGAKDYSNAQKAEVNQLETLNTKVDEILNQLK